MEIKWTGNVRDLVATVAGSDARTTYVDKSGAKIRINIDGGGYDDDTGDVGEPFYIESPDGENLYDAFDRKEAVMILSNIRRGEKFPDMPSAKPVRKEKKSKKARKSSKTATSVRMMR